MTPKNKKTIKIIAILAIVGVLFSSGMIFYLFNMPHRDVQDSETDFSLTTSQIVSEYLSNSEASNNKYLATDGNSKILEVTGTIASISENYVGQKVVLLQESSDKAGVSCVFLEESGAKVENLKVGETRSIKGVIRSGAAYDEDLELYEHIILDKCDLVK